jgi:phospholipid transport system substrate-binding protein
MKTQVAMALALGLPVHVAVAQAPDPARSTIETLQNGLLTIMRAGPSTGQSGRARLIAPIIDGAFDLPLMTRLAVGPAWTGFTEQNQAGLVAAFRALTIAEYAKNFDSYSGERFITTPEVETRGGDKFVRTTLVVPGGESEALNYRLRQSGGQWKIIDVYYRNSVSQLATRRSDFARVLASGGAPALIAHLNQLATKAR